MTRLLAEQNVNLSITQDMVCPFFGSLGMQGFGNWQQLKPTFVWKAPQFAITNHNFAAMIRIEKKICFPNIFQNCLIVLIFVFVRIEDGSSFSPFLSQQFHFDKKLFFSWRCTLFNIYSQQITLTKSSFNFFKRQHCGSARFYSLVSTDPVSVDCGKVISLGSIKGVFCWESSSEKIGCEVSTSASKVASADRIVTCLTTDCFAAPLGFWVEIPFLLSTKFPDKDRVVLKMAITMAVLPPFLGFSQQITLKKTSRSLSNDRM